MSCSAALAKEAFISPKWKGIILSAPMPDRLPPTAVAVGTAVFRLTIDPKTGGVTEVSLMNKIDANNPIAIATMVIPLTKWKFKPGSIRQIDVPVEYPNLEAELKHAVAR